MDKLDTTTIHDSHTLDREIAKLGGWQSLSPSVWAQLHRLRARAYHHALEAQGAGRTALYLGLSGLGRRILAGLSDPKRLDEERQAAERQWSVVAHGARIEPEDFGGLI